MPVFAARSQPRALECFEAIGPVLTKRPHRQELQLAFRLELPLRNASFEVYRLLADFFE
jgi:hypothetical protein